MTPGRASGLPSWAVAVFALLPAAGLAVGFVWPVAAIITRGLGDGGGEGWATTLSDPLTRRAIAATLQLATAGALGSVALGVPAAYALFRVRWPGQRIVKALLSVPFVLPTVVVGAAFSALLAPGGALARLGVSESELAIVLALVFFNVPVIMQVVGSRWQNIDPSLAEAARTLGASPARAWVATTLPALWPSIAAAAALTFLFCTTSFGLVLVLGGTAVRTVETEMYFQVTQYLDLSAATTLALVQLVFVAAAYILAAGSVARQRGSTTDVRGRGVRAWRKGDGAWVALALAPTALMVAVPLAALVERSLRVRGGGHGFANYIALVEQPARSVLPVSVAQAGLQSLVVAGVATLVTTIGALMVTVATASRARWTRGIEVVAMAPLGVSSVIVGLGLLVTWGPRLATLGGAVTWIAVAAAQAIVATPLAVRILVASSRAIDPSLRSAAATLGAGPWRVWTRVDWPLLRGSVAVTAGFAAAIALGEFGATALVARPEHPTLTLAIARLLGRPGAENVGQAFAAAVLLAVMTASLALAVDKWSVRRRAAW